MDTSGTTSGFRTSSFIRTGRAGKRTTIGKGNERGAFRAINRVPNTSDRSSGSNAKPTIWSGLTCGNISKRNHQARKATSHKRRKGTRHNPSTSRRSKVRSPNIRRGSSFSIHKDHSSHSIYQGSSRPKRLDNLNSHSSHKVSNPSGPKDSSRRKSRGRPQHPQAQQNQRPPWQHQVQGLGDPQQRHHTQEQQAQ